MSYIILMGISLFIYFFTNDLLLGVILLVYFIFILNYVNDVRQIENSCSFII